MEKEERKKGKMRDRKNRQLSRVRKSCEKLCILVDVEVAEGNQVLFKWQVEETR